MYLDWFVDFIYVVKSWKRFVYFMNNVLGPSETRIAKRGHLASIHNQTSNVGLPTAATK
jgi:hypothetical protein